MNLPIGIQQRRHPRFNCRFASTLAGAQHSLGGIIINLSKSGQFVQTASVLEPGAELELSFSAEKNLNFKLAAKVVWSRGEDCSLSTLEPAGMGLEFSQVPAEYTAYVERFQQRLAQKFRPREERFQTEHKISFQSGGW